MRIVGIIFTSLAGIGALFGVIVGIRSIPDVRRYFKMRSM